MHRTSLPWSYLCLLLLSLWAVSCNDNEGGEPDDSPGAALGQACSFDGDCPGSRTYCQGDVCAQWCDTDLDCGDGGFCEEEHCQLACQGDSDCPAASPHCVGWDTFSEPSERKRCVDDCSDSRVPLEPGKLDTWECLNGVPIDCAEDTGEACEVCGCEASQRCDAEEGCKPLSELDGPCALDRDCTSGNCSRTKGVCRVAVGAACTEENCDLCYRTEDGSWSFCSSSSCSACGDHECLGFDVAFEVDYFTCRPPCDDSCPEGACDTSTEGTSFCACEDAFACELAGGKLHGEGCADTEECRSGHCRGVRVCETNDPNDTVCFMEFGCTCLTQGVCSGDCTSDADCEGDAICGDGQCLAPCEPDDSCPRGGYCRDAAGAGGTVRVCDGKRTEGGTCYGNSDCVSGSCSYTGSFGNSQRCD